MKYNTNDNVVKLQMGKSIPGRYGNVSEIAQYNLENGTHFYTIDQVEQHKKESNPGFLSKLAQTTVKVPVTPGVSTSAATSLQNIPKIESTVGQELGYATGLLTSPILLSEIGTYGPLAGGLRLAAGSAAAAGASHVAGKGGDWLDKKLGTNWIGDTSRIVAPFIAFPLGTKAVNPILRSAAGNSITMRIPQETFMNLRNQYFTNAGNKALINLNSKSNPTLISTINHLYKEYPELSSIGPKEAYRQYYETIFPASKVQTPYAHGTKSDLSGGLETSVKVPNAAAPETIGRNDFYLNLQPEASLQYADGIGVPKGFTWNKHRFWPLKEILGKPYKSDAWMSKPIKLREQVPNRAGQFSRVKNADGTYSGHGKLLEEYKAELGMQDLSNEEFLQRLGVQNEESFNQWVAKNRQMFSDIYDSGDYHGLYHVKIDANKPLTINGGDTYYSERGIWNRMNEGGNDVLLHNNAANEFGSDVAVVRDVTPQRVRILGSKPDQQSFADFMGGKQQFFTEIPISPQEAATTYHYDPRVNLLSRPISEAEKLGVPKGERNQIVKPNPNAGAESQIDTYAINRAYNPWEIKDGKFVFKMGEPIATRGDYSEVKTPVTFHFTTDTQVKPHSGMDSWANAKTTYMVPWKSIVKYNGQPANIEPMDTWWTAGSTFEFPTKDVKVLTADPKTYRQYKLQGVDVEFSPEGRKSIQEGTGMREIVEDWIRKVQDETGMRPTTDTYRLMEQETGLRSGVTGKKVQSPWSSFIQEETNIPEYYHAPPTHSNSWSSDSMTPIHWFGDKEVQNSNFINSIVKNVANDLDDYGTFTEKDLPALQKLVQNNKVFDKQLPITYGRYGQYRYNYTGKEELVDKINRILRGEIVIPYKQGGILKGQNGTLTFEEWYKTIPKEYNDTTNYNLRRAYQLVPFKDLEKWRKNPEKNHLNSVYKDENGDYEFLKLPGHPTLNLELDWYNKADKFKKKYQLDTTSIPWKYVHINKESQPN